MAQLARRFPRGVAHEPNRRSQAHTVGDRGMNRETYRPKFKILVLSLFIAGYPVIDAAASRVAIPGDPVPDEEAREIVDKFLYYPSYPYVSCMALKALCEQWGLTHAYLKELKQFIKGVPWDVNKRGRVLRFARFAIYECKE